MRLFLALAILVTTTGASLAEVPAVVATIKPIHSLVAAVMGDLGRPALIVRGAASPHSYSLKPSDAAALEAANLIFWTGPDLELFLDAALATLAPDATVVALGEAPGITLLPTRAGGAFEPHANEPAHAGGGEEMDMHVFLDPANARAMVAEIAAVLSAADPEHAPDYGRNAAARIAALDGLLAGVAAELAPVRDRPFVVFHDAYQYFERRFGLNAVGSITVNPETMPGADRIAEIRGKLRSLDSSCVFAEPQFDPRIIDVLVEGTPARRGVLDPEGANLAEGPELYAELIKSLARSLVECLGQ